MRIAGAGPALLVAQEHLAGQLADEAFHLQAEQGDRDSGSGKLAAPDDVIDAEYVDADDKKS